MKDLQIAQLQGKRDEIKFCKDCSAPMVCCDENLDNHTDVLLKIYLHKIIMKILVTGSNGFIGANIKEFFKNKFNVLAPKRESLNLLDSIQVENYLKNFFDVVIHCGVTLTSVDENLKMYLNLEKCSKFLVKWCALVLVQNLIKDIIFQI